jgi:hypothetical protein
MVGVVDDIKPGGDPAANTGCWKKFAKDRHQRHDRHPASKLLAEVVFSIMNDDATPRPRQACWTRRGGRAPGHLSRSVGCGTVARAAGAFWAHVSVLAPRLQVSPEPECRRLRMFCVF